MARIDQYGNLVADTGGFIGLPRNPGESDEDYVARGESFNQAKNSGSNSGSYPGSPNYTDEQNYINNQNAYYQSIADAQRSQSLAAIQSRKNDIINSYKSQKAEMLPKYTAQANQVDVNAANAAKKIREIMAASGMYRSGGSVSDQASNLSQAYQAKNDVETNKNTFINDIGSKIALAEKQSADDSQAAIESIASQLAALKAKSQNDWLNYSNQKSQNDFNNAIAAAQVTGYTPNLISNMYPAWNVGARTYGTAGDVAANPGINLYIPGQTQLHPGDIYLGGTATGVSDDMLNGAQRIAGYTANDTAALYRNYLNSVGAGQTPSVATTPTLNTLPSSIAQQFPGATDISYNNGRYKFRDAAGNIVYYVGG